MNPTITPLDAETRRRIINRLMKEHQFSEEMASAVLDETLVFMYASVNSEISIGPSELVDHGWHTFILYTREYMEYCQRAFGKFLHHAPSDREGEVGPALKDTINFFTANGIVFDPGLWGMKASCVGHGGPNCGTQLDPELAFANQLGDIRTDCDNGGYGGGGCCRGQCS